MEPKSLLRSIINSTRDSLKSIYEKNKEIVTLVIPALNEEKSIAKVIKKAKEVPEITEIIVIDDGSKDQTSKIAKSLGVEVVSHHKNLGKGEAIRTGIAHARGDIIVFLDADLKNIEIKKIRALILPIIKNKADFTKGIFTRARGRITEFAVRPMMEVIYPEKSFKQPISGQFAGRKEFLEKIEIEPKWGIDIAILLDAIKTGQRVLEVNMGVLVHKKRPDSEVAKTSKEVLETILKKSGYMYNKNKAIIFSDKTLIKRNKLDENSKMLLEELKKKKIKTILITEKDQSIEIKNSFTTVRKTKPEEIKKIIKRALKDNDGIRLSECLMLSNKLGFEKIATKVDKSLCFENSPAKLKKVSKTIKSPVEILLHIE